MKKYIAFILSCMLLVFQCSFVFAEEPEQYEMVEMEILEVKYHRLFFILQTYILQ